MGNQLTGPALDYSFQFYNDQLLHEPTPQDYQLKRF